MFTWICPNCKQEVPPHLSECPNCALLAAGQAPPQSAAPPQPGQAPPQPYPPMQYAPQPTHMLPPPAGMPKWVATMMMVGGIALAAGLVYFFFYAAPRAKAPAPAAKAEPSGVAKSNHPYAKFVEVTGVRVAEDAKKSVVVKVVVINHSNAELAEMELKVDVRPSTAKDGDPPLCEVSLKVPSLGPGESKDVSAAGKTSLRAYEMPDWQFLHVDFEILAPKI
jgi:hypothetical protein